MSENCKNKCNEVDRHCELVEVINKEIGEMSGNVKNSEEVKNIWKKKDEKEVEEKKHLNQYEAVKRYTVLNTIQIEYERSNTHGVEMIKSVKKMRMFEEGYKESVMMKVVSNPTLRKNMMCATELRTGRPSTSQPFMFAIHSTTYVCDAYKHSVCAYVQQQLSLHLITVDMTSSS